MNMDKLVIHDAFLFFDPVPFDNIHIGETIKNIAKSKLEKFLSNTLVTLRYNAKIFEYSAADPHDFIRS
jgi:hypothetical protein